MIEFYENNRDQTEEVMISRSRNHVFPAHFHLSFEVLLVKKGGYDITLAGKKYSVGPNSVVLIDSYEPHSYDRCHMPLCEIDDCVIDFPYSYMTAFNSMRDNQRIANPIINDAELCSELLEITDKYISAEPHILMAGVHLFFAKLFDKIEFSEVKKRDEPSLVRRILLCISDGFKGDCSRKKIAAAIGYTEEHVSRVFHRYIGTGISEYVNGVRLAYIDRLRKIGDKRPAIELIYEAGFKSQQTYYRAKKKRNGENKPCFL